MNESPGSTPRASLLRHPDFMKLWTAESISVFGSQISALAIPVVAILILHVSPFEVALLGTIEFLPFILFTLPAGAWVDRLRRRPIMIVGDVGRAIALSTIPLAFALDVLTIWQLYVVGFVTGTLTVFFDVSNQSYLPSIVDRDDLVEGNSKLQISQSAAQIAGPGIAGVLIEVVRAPFAILLDALSFLVSAFFVFLIRKPEPPMVHAADLTGERRPSIVTEVRQGLSFVLRNPSLRAISAGTATSNLFGSIGFAIYALYVLDPRYLGLGPGQLGLVFAVGNVGSLQRRNQRNVHHPPVEHAARVLHGDPHLIKSVRGQRRPPRGGAGVSGLLAFGDAHEFGGFAPPLGDQPALQLHAAAVDTLAARIEQLEQDIGVAVEDAG